MAGARSTSSSSSLTSTSHTLTHAPATVAAMPSAKDALSFLDVFQPANRHTFLKPPSAVTGSSLQAIKETLDAFAGQVADEQHQRLRDAGKKRKRGAHDGSARRDILKMRRLHVEGFETSQVWQQAKRIISTALAQSQEILEELEQDGAVISETAIISNGHVTDDASSEEVSEDEEDEDDEGESSISSDDDDEADEEELDVEEGESEEDAMEDGFEDEDLSDLEEAEAEAEPEIFQEDPNGLNDGFFSIDDFNKQTLLLEDRNARGEDEENEDDEDEQIDYFADPFAVPVKSKANGSRKSQADDLPESEDEDDAGPTFGNMDLFAPEGASDEEMEDDQEIDDGFGGGDELYYKDFFAPPAKKGKKGQRPYRPTLPESIKPEEADIERAMADVRRDLFEDESEFSESDGGLSDVSAGDPRSRRSAHERRQAKLLEEIRRLEAESVKKKDWAMSGEASASARPLNSLLEEELDFEHAGRPVPVITQEVSKSIEEMIKRRIIDQQFDEVLRRYPSDGDNAPARRGLVEIDDSKPTKGLAEIYEEDHVKNRNPDVYVSKSEEKLRKEEQEIEGMWKDVCAKLDALSSWHYKPKPAAPSLTVVSDIATVAMEDAQPTTAQGVNGGESMLAPQEIYKAGQETADKGEVVLKGGMPLAREEMSREEKVRRRRRQKERIKKTDEEANKKPLGKRAQEKKDTVADLKRGGVKVINRKGEVVDLEGNKAQAAKAVSSGAYKL